MRSKNESFVKGYGEFRKIPGVEGYLVSNNGLVLESRTNTLIKQTNSNGYIVVPIKQKFTVNDKVLTKLVVYPVHRLVALAWVDNPDPVNKTDVNHIDGVKYNNYYKNLEWVTTAENTIHAHENNLSSASKQRTKCRIRDFETGEVIEFDGQNEATRHMGFDAPVNRRTLLPKMYGRLIKGRWEFRPEGDDRPWFYETRKNKVLSRYRLTVKKPDGSIEEFYDKTDVVKKFKLYNLAGNSFLNIYKFLIREFPNFQFIFEDAYEDYNHLTAPIPKSKLNISENRPLIAYNRELGYAMVFSSSRKCSEILGINRKLLYHFIDELKEIKGWLICVNDLELIEFHYFDDNFTSMRSKVKFPFKINQ